MCFRPATVTPDVKCPECGKMNPFGEEVCAACGAALPKDSIPGMPAAPGMPGMPAAPGMPSAPAAPGMPGTPKA